MENIDDWHALHNLSMFETCEIKGYGPFTLRHLLIKYPNLFVMMPLSSATMRQTEFVSTFLGKRIEF